MKTIRLFTSLSIFFLISCGALKREINNAVSIQMNLIIPDSCDMYLLKDIFVYRKDSLKFPTYVWASEKINSYPKVCQASFDSINIISFGKDSAALYMRKSFIDAKNQRILLPKYYRVKFVNDSLITVSPYTKTSKK